MATSSALQRRSIGTEVLLDILLSAGVFAAVLVEGALAVGRTDTPRVVRPDRDDDHLFRDQSLHFADGHGTTDSVLLLLVVAVLAAVGVGLRRRWPLPGMAAAAAAAVLGAFVLGQPFVVSAAFALTLYSVAVERGWLSAGISAAASCLVVVVGVASLEREGGFGVIFVFVLVAVVVPLLSAAATRSRRAYLAEVEARLRQADAEREAETARALADERVALARDLHDVLAHSLTVVNLQVGVASHLLADHPDRAAHALDEARAAGSAAVDELRSTLALLRGEGAEQLSPVPGIGDIEALVDRVRATGLPVTLHLEDVSGVGEPVGLVAYRVVQESLTNVVKHAGARAATTVTVRRRDDLLELLIDNAPGATTGAPSSGIGLESLRERVGALGGTFASGPMPDGGFRVHALLRLPSTGGPAGPPDPTWRTDP